MGFNSFLSSFVASMDTDSGHRLVPDVRASDRTNSGYSLDAGMNERLVDVQIFFVSVLSG